MEYEGDDFYCYPDTKVLINRFNIRNYEILQAAEREFSYAKITKLQQSPFKGTLDLKYLQKIHRFIFEDIYTWAGRIRGGQFFSKGETEFVRAPMIYTYADNIFGKLRNEEWLRRLPREQFIERLAYYMAEINTLHPFREGNGRTQRLFFEESARRARYQINFSDVEPDTLLEADIEAYNKNYAPMIVLLNQIVVP
ncbi:MAG: Fic family protein [Oscillospiraceae bacterium]|nr:Fic family protein [Oscillospiraceae bacterium]